MGSTFMGLETARRGLTTQQSALYTTGHNISNANTVGYSRQRVNMEATLGYPGTGLNAPKIPGHLGTGVQAQSVQRVRDQFIDRQYRQETSKLGYWETKSNAVSQMEDILSEPSDFGLNTSLDQFWSSLQILGTSPDDASTRQVVVQKGIAVAESFNYISKQLTEIQENLKNEILVTTKDMNSILKQIASINEEIQAIEPNGYMPNDLYDARDVLLDELSSYFPVEVSYEKSGGNALAIAEGSMNITIKTSNGPVSLVNGKEFSTVTANTGANIPITDAEGYQPFTSFTISGYPIPIKLEDLEANKGQIHSLISSYGYGEPADNTGFYPEMLKKLDELANAFAKTFNDVHTNGSDLKGNKGQEFFINKTDENISTGITASNIKVHSKFEKDPSLLAASTSDPINGTTGKPEPGNGANALLLANIKAKPADGLGGATIQTYYQSMIGQMGVVGEQANRLATNSATIQLTVANNRASVSSVSLDEEMTNMITFQQAYNANARMITVVDETLDKIINGMGRVGL
ncbi:flagellar hook-associated protein 1 FlgK [Psychrobacillus psychrotolerans]|uniref:Flagellar hook-associated protein 1 n=1 Tax=Psychrobacillus psychrotolerans TaxID=126156 RepID=A0A1I5ZAJ0_9BACI|nr:flagellar hook-associated protein FlgK [Psychrobacillus psychrotolerans]SFQ53415.1 flagellar hook-associated protein 1 FlgK [Psychrobacillus psychrotolerans]